MKVSELLKALKKYTIYGNKRNLDIEVTGLSSDSRSCRKGEVFICFQGQKVDSHEYAEEVIEKGVVAIVVERKLEIDCLQIMVEDARLAMSLLATTFYGSPSERMKVIGITGTNGKTTCSYMLASILKSAGKKTGIIGTLGIYYDKKEIAPELTTPDPIYLQRILADMLERGIEYVVMEVSAHALYYKKLEGVRFCACIFTNFTQDHLDFFSSMQDYKEAKLQLFQPKKCPLAIVNADDEVSKEISRLRELDGNTCKTCFYALKTPSDAFAVVVDEDLKETEFILNINDSLCSARLKMTGSHNVYNALAVAVCAYELGIPKECIGKGLTTMQCVKGRLEWIASYHGSDIFIDFAHTPDGLEKSLTSLRKYCAGRLICIFGCGGNRDKSKRPKMGEVASRNADFIILTSDNPRYEEPFDIIKDIESGIDKERREYVTIPEREKAICYGLKLLKKGDVLLVAGKGGEDYQERMGIKYAYKDEDLIINLMKKG